MQVGAPSERAFGVGVGGVCVALGTVLWWRGHSTLSLTLLVLGGALVVLGRLAPSALRARGIMRLEAPSAALISGAAHDHRVEAGLKEGPPRDARTIVLYGRRPLLVGWRAAYEGRPAGELLRRVRHVTS